MVGDSSSSIIDISSTRNTKGPKFVLAELNLREGLKCLKVLPKIEPKPISYFLLGGFGTQQKSRTLKYDYRKEYKRKGPKKARV